MKLNRALICLDCEEIVEVTDKTCICGSEILFPLEAWLTGSVRGDHDHEHDPKEKQETEFQ